MATSTEDNLSLDENYFKDILDKHYGVYKIKKFSTSNASAKGENYASIMTLATLTLELEDGRIEEVSYVIKALPEGEVIRKIVINLGLFPKELEMLSEVVPKFEELLNGVGDSVQLCARCFKVTIAPMAIVMENLKQRHFKMANRLEGLDLEHSKLVLKKLGKLHAASMYWYKKNGEFSEQFIRGIYTEENRGMYETLYKSNGVVLRKCLLENGVDKVLLNKLAALEDTYYDRQMEKLDLDPDGFNVLNHGDLWVNNMMFQYNEDGKVNDVIFLDYQLCKWGPPTQDINYFIMSSCNYDIRISQYDYMIQFYFGELVNCLKMLNYEEPLPKLIQLNRLLIERGFFAVMTSLGVTSFALLDKNEEADFDNFTKNSKATVELKHALYSNPRYVKAMKQLLPFFNNKGFLDP